MIKSALVIPKVWRSEIEGVMLFLVFSAFAVVLSHTYPGSIISGKLFTIGSKHWYLSFPLWSILPLTPLLTSMFRIYNVRYTIDKTSIETRKGIISTKQSISTVRYTDIRSININHTIIERILDIGDLEISTAASSNIELCLEGIAVPEEVKAMLERERTKRQEIDSQDTVIEVDTERATAASV